MRRTKHRRRGTRLLIITVLLVATAWAPMSVIAHTMSKVEADLETRVPAAEVLDEPLPEFRFEDRAGSPVSLSDFAGSVVILSFDERRSPGSCVAIDRIASKVRALVAGAKGLSEQIRFATVITGKRGNSESPDSQCQESASEREPPLELFIKRMPGTLDSPFAEAHGFGQGVASGALVVDPSGRIRARFRGPAFAPVELMMFAAALAHGEHGIPPATKSTEGRASLDPATVRLTLGGAFGLLGILAYVLYTRSRRRTLTREPEKEGR